MNRIEFHKQFKVPGPAVLPVIHVQNRAQVSRNIELAVRCGAQGVFLINHDFDVPAFIPLLEECRQAFPSVWMGVNFLGVTGRDAFPVLGEMEQRGVVIDAYWADDARIEERTDDASEVEEIAAARSDSGWTGLYFGGTAFKKQRAVDPAHYVQAASEAARWTDVVTTSGPATGQTADLSKIAKFRTGVAQRSLAIASGITPENVGDYAREVDAILVATGINRPGDFYEIDQGRLTRLLDNCRHSHVVGESPPVTGTEGHERWYLRFMAPTLKGDTFAWLDPSSAYIKAQAFSAMVDDLLAPFRSERIDVVAGVDAAGYVLGAALAVRLGTGLLTIRKAGKLPVPTDEVEFVNYTQRPQSMELRVPACRPGTRVLLVDQWVETGGTIGAAIELIERQGGVIAGIATICIEETPETKALQEKYRCVASVLPGSDFQAQCNAKHMAFFDDFDWDRVLADTLG
ncbi:MAG: phosphoribosyltransferase family protein [Pseudomonadota bacterium]|nr:phosphoribosyltransferase family protein [Pseudomonadota bacterium]